MTKLLFPLLFTVSFLSVLSFPPLIHALGSGSTLAVAYGTATVCAILAAERIICQRAGDTATSFFPLLPNISYSTVAGGQNSICALRSGDNIMLCWDTNAENFSANPKRLYHSTTVSLQHLAIGDERICATNTTSLVACWRPTLNNSEVVTNVNNITSGVGFSCGIQSENNQVACWGSNNMTAKSIEDQFGNMTMINIVAGFSHVCGVNSSGDVVCKGNNSLGQLNVPSDPGLKFDSGLASTNNCAPGLALGEGFSCGIRCNRTVVCWGSMNASDVEGTEFESIVSGSNFTCGLTTRNFSVLCWGPGWPSYNRSNPMAPPPMVPRRSSPSRALRRGLLAYAIVGSVGAFLGICTIIYCLWTGVCFGKKKVHNSVQPTINRAGSNGGTGSSSGPPSRSLTIRRQFSRSMKRQRSGTSSKHADRAEEFTFVELAAATNGFSLENKIGAGSYGVVYRGKLLDGRDVAIKRGETGQITKKYQEKETAFESELAFLSRLHHKHLVRLVGYCDENDERLLVYEYMKNGALHDHLHDKNNVEKSSSLVNSWRMRIKIALDAARGIEYLHNYAVPPIIHRDIKSSNILLDTNWTARVSDFGLSLMGPESQVDFRTMKAAGTVGYIDPEYYGLNVLTTKSDVYGLGVVMLELLTGKRAIFKSDENGGTPISLVDFAVPEIMNGELVKVLDYRVGPPGLNEAEAVELMANIAVHCVHLEGKERPAIGDVVYNLERAVNLCEGSHGSISSGTFSIVSE